MDLPLLRLAIVLGAVLSGCGGGLSLPGAAPDAGPPDLATTAPDLGPAIPDGVHPLRGADPGLPDDDLAALDVLVGDARVVGLGESIHTSGGFHDMKARMVRHLVEKKGFRQIAWEWQRVSGDVVDQYLADCVGGGEHAAKQLSVWASTSVQHMLEWACTFNQAHPDDRVRFIGFDVQQPSIDLDKLKAWLPGSGIADPASVSGALERCDRGGGTTYVGDYAPCVAALSLVQQHLAQHGAALEAQTSHEAVELVRMAQLGAAAWQTEMFDYGSDNRTAYQVRDDAMAEMFFRARALRFPTAKTIVWAHNYHLRKQGAAVTGPAAIGAVTMGTRLAAALAADYVPIALVAYEVAIDWPGVGCGPQPPADGNDSVESTLEALGVGDLLVDFAHPGVPPALTLGEQVGEGWYERSNLVEQYAGLVFLHSSPAMTPLAWPACTPAP